MEDKFIQFEAEAMRRIVAEDPSISELLKKQYKSAEIISREFTGVGFFTRFNITDVSSRLPGSVNLELGAAHARIEGIEHGAGFVLFIRGGLIKTLEGYTFDEPWPERITAYSFE